MMTLKIKKVNFLLVVNYLSDFKFKNSEHFISTKELLANSSCQMVTLSETITRINFSSTHMEHFTFFFVNQFCSSLSVSF